MEGGRREQEKETKEREKEYQKDHGREKGRQYKSGCKNKSEKYETEGCGTLLTLLPTADFFYSTSTSNLYNT